jgi:hypothetical protein
MDRKFKPFFALTVPFCPSPVNTTLGRGRPWTSAGAVFARPIRGLDRLWSVTASLERKDGRKVVLPSIRSADTGKVSDTFLSLTP